MPTKSEQMKYITAGLIHECFEHETHGLFDVTLMRKAARNHRYGNPITIPFDPRYAEKFMLYRDYELDRIWELLMDPKAPWLNDPAMGVYDDSDGTHIFIDGTHRILCRWILKLPTFSFWQVPMSKVIRPQQGFAMVGEWGEENFVQNNSKRLRQT